jgi:hypothetical protein
MDLITNWPQRPLEGTPTFLPAKLSPATPATAPGAVREGGPFFGFGHSYRSGARPPASRAWRSEQNQRSPWSGLIFVRSYHCEPHGVR